MQIRALAPCDSALLEELLYLAIWQPPGTPALSRAIIEQPELSRYVSLWGHQAGDLGFVAEQSPSQPLGAVWLRLLQAPGGYGFWDSATPELSIAVVPEARNQGIGTRLLQHAIAAASTQFQAISLSVSPANPSVHLYERFGFALKETRGGSLVMVLSLANPTTSVA